MATMHKLVSPEGVLHLLPVDDRSILEFTKVHGITEGVLHRVLLKFSRLY